MDAPGSCAASAPDDAPLPHTSTIERAFQLARSGACRTVVEIILRLKQERYDAVEAHLAGPSIRRDLRRLCSEAQADAAADTR